MPFQMKLDKETKLVLQIGSGFVKANDVKQAFEKYVSDSEFEAKNHVVWDLRDAIVDATPNELQELMKQLAEVQESNEAKFRLAFLIKERLAKVLNDIFNKLTSSLAFEVDIFTDYDKALSWASQPE